MKDKIQNIRDRADSERLENFMTRKLPVNVINNRGYYDQGNNLLFRRGCHFTIDNFAGFELTGSGCLLNSVSVDEGLAGLNPTFKLPSLSAATSRKESSLSVPK